MTSTSQYARCDTKKPDGFYVQFTRVILPDDTVDRPDERQDGFWPSRDKNDPGYVGDVSNEEFAAHQAKAQAIMAGFESGEWSYVGVRAAALCLLVRDGTGTYINLESPGLWGIESDAGDYLNEVYAEEIETLKSMIQAIRQFEPVYES